VPVGIPFKHAGSTVMLLGGLGAPDPHQFGGTQYAKVIHNLLWGKPPRLDMDYEKRVQAAIRELVREGAVESAHDIGDGGLAVALAECCFGPENVGVEISLNSSLEPELLLFHEGPSRILVSTSDPDKVFASAKRNGIEAPVIGATLKAGMKISNRNEMLIDNPVDELKDLWNSALVHLLHNPVLV